MKKILYAAIGYLIGAILGFSAAYHPQYDGEGNKLPKEAVTALVRSQYVVTSKAEDSLINKYFK